MSKELFQQLIDSKIKNINEPHLFSLIKINIDAHGAHNTGHDPIDKIIFSAAKHLKKTLRKHDSCTLANNELTLLLPDTPTDEAGKAGLRIISILKSYLAKAGIIFIKISFSLSALPVRKSSHPYWKTEVASVGRNNKNMLSNKDIKISYF